MSFKVSVVIVVRNEDRHINKCLTSIRNQTVTDFEILIIDDFSTDNTRKLIEKFNDKRIKYLINEKWLGIPKSRNRAVKYAKGEYLFFTDGDCHVSRDWIEQGLKYFEKRKCVGVEGRIYYVSKSYKPTFSDHIMENRNGGNFMTGNIAYKKDVVEKVGGFDENMGQLEDRDIALRIRKHGKIIFNPDMIVYHPKVTMTPKMLIQSASYSRNRVLLFKKFREKKFFLWRLLLPLNIVKIFVPPIIFLYIFSRKFDNVDDYKLVPFTYLYLICERLQIWRECVRERVFII